MIRADHIEQLRPGAAEKMFQKLRKNAGHQNRRKDKDGAARQQTERRVDRATSASPARQNGDNRHKRRQDEYLG